MRSIRRYVVSILFVLLVLVALLSSAFFLDIQPRLGLDLRGGLLVILTAPDGTRTDVLDKTVEILRARIDRAGVTEPEISREGSNNIQIQVPGIEDEGRLLTLIGRTAQLQFRQVLQESPSGDPAFEQLTPSEKDDPKQEVVLFGRGGDDVKYRMAPAELTGESVRDAKAVVDPNSGGWTVELRFDREGSRAWEQFTGRLACLQGPERRVAIVLDARVESSPQVAENVGCNEGISGGSTQIEGSFTERQSKDLALVLTTGALPVELEQSQITSVSPTLGRDSLRAGLVAGTVGLALVMIYVLIYYRALGLQTWIGLATFAAIIYGIVVVLGQAIGWSLTLAGIAGLIVAIGIATDSYIVFFERVKEEVHEGKSLRSSMDRGFAQAWKTLRAANAVTIFAAIILYVLAVGPVRGFALSLGMATTLDLAIFAAFTWPVAALLARNHRFSEGRFIGMRRALEGGKKGSVLTKIYRSEFNIDFVGRRRIWLTISLGLVAIAVVALVPMVRGLTFGIDFQGGTIFRVSPDRSVAPPEVQNALAEAGQTDAVVQILRDRTSGRTLVQVQTEAIEDPDERERITEAFAPFADPQDVDVEAVGEKWGRQVTEKALRGLVVFVILVIIYMSWRLEPKMAVAGMAALIHDLIITAGIYALVGFPVTPATVIAILTILGYSLYDTVVVFDKIRENVALPSNARKSFKEIANASMNQVLMRSINTSLVTLLPVGSLLFVGSFLLGAATLKDLALALFIGIAAGTYSSIFVAVPILSIWKEREPRYSSVRAKVLKETEGRPAIPAKVPSQEGDGRVEGDEEDKPSGEVARPSRDRARQTVRVQQRKRTRSQRKRGKR